MKNLLKISYVILFIFLVHSCCKDEDNIIKDADGNVYTSKIIGTQTWMVENLKTTRYINGDLIGSTPTEFTLISNDPTSKYHWPDVDMNDEYVSSFGRLYTWYAVKDIRNVCPAGWHVPSDAEWVTLTDYLGGVSLAGDKLKELCGEDSWRCYPFSEGNTETNESGFTALPGGLHDYLFDHMANRREYEVGYWWSSTEYSDTNAWALEISWGTPVVSSGKYEKRLGFSVRCLQD